MDSLSSVRSLSRGIIYRWSKYSSKRASLALGNEVPLIRREVQCSCRRTEKSGEKNPGLVSSITAYPRMDICNTTFSFKKEECFCVSTVKSPEWEWWKRGTSRIILPPFSSYHRCPSSKTRTSKPVSPQLLSEVLQYVRYFPVSSQGLPRATSNFYSHALNLGLSSFPNPSLCDHGPRHMSH